MNYNPSQLPDISKVEIVNLKHVSSGRGGEYIKFAASAQSVKIDGDLAQEIADLWRKLQPDEQMRCHIPPFGVRFYKGDRLIIEGSICWECNNIFLNENGKDLFYTFDGQHQYSQQLLTACKKAFELKGSE